MKASETVKKKSPTSDEKALLTMLVEELKKMNKKLNSIAEANTKILKTQEKFLKRITNERHRRKDTKPEPDAMALLSLPSSLRKTVMVLYKLEKATAEDLASETKRLRAVESASANQLVRMGYLKKKREGRKVYFYIE
jgi:hypothetical protein